MTRIALSLAVFALTVTPAFAEEPAAESDFGFANIPNGSVVTKTMTTSKDGTVTKSMTVQQPTPVDPRLTEQQVALATAEVGRYTAVTDNMSDSQNGSVLGRPDVTLRLCGIETDTEALGKGPMKKLADRYPECTEADAKLTLAQAVLVDAQNRGTNTALAILNEVPYTSDGNSSSVTRDVAVMDARTDDDDRFGGSWRGGSNRVVDYANRVSAARERQNRQNFGVGLDPRLNTDGSEGIKDTNTVPRPQTAVELTDEQKTAIERQRLLDSIE